MAGSTNVGSFVPTTNVWDVQQIYELQEISPEFKELLVRLYQNINLISIVLNTKDSGYYALSEFVNGQLYFPNPSLNSLSSTNPTYRQVSRIVVTFGALPNTGTKSVAHNVVLNPACSSTRIYATATDPSDIFSIPIPYASASGTENIEINVDSTNVNIITASDRTNYTITYVVLEYLTS